MAPQTPQPGVIESKSSQTTGTSPTAPLAETQQQRRDQLIHRNAAIAATKYMAQDAHLKNHVKPDAAMISSSMRLDVSSSIWR